MSALSADQLALASCKFHLWTVFLNEDLCKKNFDFHIFSFFLIFNHIHWFYPYRSFKHSTARRHKSGHT